MDANNSDADAHVTRQIRTRMNLRRVQFGVNLKTCGFIKKLAVSQVASQERPRPSWPRRMCVRVRIGCVEKLTRRGGIVRTGSIRMRGYKLITFEKIKSSL